MTQSQQRAVQTYAAIAAGALVLLFIKKGFDGALSFLGLKKDEYDKAVAEESSNPASPWSPNYWQSSEAKKNRALLIKEAAVQDMIQKIYKSVGYLQDDWSTAFAQIKRCKTKSMISYLAYKFQQKYGKDLLEWLPGGSGWPNDRFSNEQVAQAIAYVNTLPKYKLK